MARTRRVPAKPQSAQSTTAPSVWWRPLLIAAAGALAYANSLAGPFVYDDLISIVGNQQIRDWTRLAVLAPERELPTAGRPLVNLSFALNFAAGGLNVAGYHLVNIAIHLACGLLVFGVVRRTLELPALRQLLPAAPSNLALAAALLWTLHPLNTEAVNYLTQRTELMMGLFYLLTVYASVRAFGGPAWWKGVAAVACAAGMACKESMATAPVTIVLYDSVFLYESLRHAWHERWRFYTALASSWVVLAVVMWSGPRIHSAGFSSGASPWTYLLNQTVMLGEYLRHTVWPRGLVITYGSPQPVTIGDVWPYALMSTALLVITLVVFIRRPKWGFLGLWFFITLAPTSSIVPIATEVGAERRMYLPLVAVIVLAVIGASFLRRAATTAGAAAVAAVAVLFAAGTFDRNREYASELGLSRTVVERHPTGVAHHMLANDLLAAGDHDAGMRELRLAVPGDSRAHHTLGAELLKAGQVDEAIVELQAFLRDQPLLLQAVSARELLGQAFIAQSRWAEAIDQEQTALTMNPTPAERANAHGLIGDALFGAQKYGEAIPHFEEYLRFNPTDFGGLMRLGVACISADRTEEAIAAFRRATAAQPTNADAERNLANALYDHREATDAASHAQRAVELHPSDAQAHDVLGRSLAVLGRLDEARVQFEQALQIEPGNSEVRDHLAKLQTLTRR